MQLIDQHTKSIMEGCKERARDAGLRFSDETLEYIVTNRDMLELHPKVMIPTLYDYWVHDVEVLKEKGKYELYPHNPYETVINTRPPISFYNDNNPDWLNVMIFYHVLAHIDFFQNNIFFRHTWEYDLTGKALADKRLIARLRSEHGRWVDYVIEFARSIDNLVGYFDVLSGHFRGERPPFSRRLDYYFDVFLQTVKRVKTAAYVKEIERYNQCLRDNPELGEEAFFADVVVKHPEFEALFLKSLKEKKAQRLDLMQFIMEQSPFLNRDENRWMKGVLEVVRSTSVYFQPQIRTKIMNEGWASYWHETLFLTDERIAGHEVDFARVHSGVTSLPRVGLNPYAIGMRLFQQIEEMADKGRISLEFQRLADIDSRKKFDRATGTGREFIFAVRENLCDFSFITRYVDQDFVDRHDLFVVGKRLDKARMRWQYYVKSRKAEAYREMLLDALYHPPRIEVDPKKGGGEYLYLNHTFEGKPLVKDFIANSLMGIEYLWGGPVKLETTEAGLPPPEEAVKTTREEEKKIHWRRFVYTMENRTLSRTVL
ncbi:SpoVR family protein [Geobacter pickeringii]|uniref:SpoVR family protein n=1 Tax=Geobacter pickeringii TaxID=345632 RepID=A0A0B5BD06_9BACT|nr:SpoVR family protein [Geobacter pickeringii]AJE01981.1 SpoVR family protein [Geobacter pickeringii]